VRQVLLDLGDFINATVMPIDNAIPGSYFAKRGSFRPLMKMTTSTEGNKIGDNDKLSALVASLLHEICL